MIADILSLATFGERAVGNIFSPQFQALEEILNEELTDPITYKSGVQKETHQKPPRAAELMSAVFVLSPEMQTLIEMQSGMQTPLQELLPMIASLIIGRAYNLVYDGQYLHFMKSIVSGDLDADKIDYLARDGYFAGLPLAVDVDRLLSQLKPITFDAQTHIDGLDIDFSVGGVDKYRVLGLKPTGASAMEMLVLTRAYLFDRIYLHHKVRAAERLAERVLRQFLSWIASITAKANSGTAAFDQPAVQREILEFMLGPGGDDAALASIAAGGPGGSAPTALRDSALRLLRRRLPARSLPIARRTLAGAVRNDQPVATMLRTRWPEIHGWLRSEEGQTYLEDRICQLTDSRLGADVIVDFAQRDPINEDPDIWVQTSATAQPERLNRHFSVEQLSNAYQELKETGWVFAWAEHRPQVAAATAFALHEWFGVVPTEHALNLGKVTPVQYDGGLTKIETKHDLEPEACARLRQMAEAPHLYVHKGDVINFIPEQWDRTDRENFAQVLARGSPLDFLAIARKICRFFCRCFDFC